MFNVKHHLKTTNKQITIICPNHKLYINVLQKELSRFNFPYSSDLFNTPLNISFKRGVLALMTFLRTPFSLQSYAKLSNSPWWNSLTINDKTIQTNSYLLQKPLKKQIPTINLYP